MLAVSCQMTVYTKLNTPSGGPPGLELQLPEIFLQLHQFAPERLSQQVKRQTGGLAVVERLEIQIETHWATSACISAE
jgi:hypothetical protein